MALSPIVLAIVIIASIYILFKAFHKFVFLRNPERTIPKGRNVVSPADGKILEIMEINTKKITIKKGKIGKIRTIAKDVAPSCYVISIFMSPMDVHYNRAPVEGKILYSKHSNGRYLPVNTVERGLVNEKNEILIKHNTLGNVKVIQIAGFLARRIITWSKKGDTLKKGEQFGLINLGSQATVILPTKVKIKVKKGDKVKAGESILATY